MARKNAEDAAADFDDLLAADEPETATPEDEEESAEDRRIAELKAALAAPSPFEQAAEPVVKTAKQLEIEKLEDELARRSTAFLEKAPETFRESVGPGEKILIHFRKDGLILLGTVWLRGQELEITVGSPDYKRTLNKRGESWLDLRDDEDAQILKWGERMIASGPFKPRKGEEFADEVAKADRRRGRAVPVVGR